MALERPRFALRIGVTGHLKLAAEEQCRAGIQSALAMVQSVTRKIREDSLAAFAADAVLFRAVSALAEGADRLFAAEALDLKFELDCVLPFAQAEYERDFASDESISEFRGLLSRVDGRVLELDSPTNPDERSAAYESAGRAMLDQCDLLLTIWNGEPAKGPGGTGQIIEIARRKGMPILWIHSKTGVALLKTRRNETPLNEEALLEPLGLILKPPQSKDPDVTGSYRAAIPEKPSLLSRSWELFRSAMTTGLKLSPSYEEREPKGPFVELYQHFDAIANRMAGLYRGSHVTSSALGVCAVFLALLGFVLPQASEVWLSIELAAVSLVYALTIAVNRKEWHYRSVDCRYIAEQFRVLCAVYSLALSAPPPRIPAHHRHGNVARSWMEWLLRATIRSAPMPKGKVDPAFLQRVRAELVEGWILGQISYHHRNAQRMECLQRRSDLLVRLCVAIAAASCVLHFFVANHEISKWFTLGAAGFPAVAAAFHAIATQGEFRRLANRSNDMRESLENIETRFLALGDTPTFVDLRRIANEAAELIVEEVADWQILYRKPVEPS
jgi:hypothetical protein